jgi:phage/plasmid-associated DNA primase
MLNCVGDYGYKLPSHILLNPLKAGANPEIFNLVNKRFVLSQEPDEKQKFNTGTLKELTGDTTINARNLYSDNCKVKLTSSLFLEANKLPNLDAVNDALYRRIDVTPFVTKAVSKEEYESAENKTNLNISNPYYKTDRISISIWNCIISLFETIF